MWSVILGNDFGIFLTIFFFWSVPNYIVSESEVEASKEGRSLTDFKYACVGYSIYMDQNKGAPLDGDQKPRAELPVCVGVEVGTFPFCSFQCFIFYCLYTLYINI